MNKILARIARENFRSSGYLKHPRRERPTVWTFTAPPRSPFFSSDAVRDALQRRERALLRASRKRHALSEWFHALRHR
jgi:hypothetical protein